MAGQASPLYYKYCTLRCDERILADLERVVVGPCICFHCSTVLYTNSPRKLKHVLVCYINPSWPFYVCSRAGMRMRSNSLFLLILFLFFTHGHGGVSAWPRRSNSS